MNAVAKIVAIGGVGEAPLDGEAVVLDDLVGMEAKNHSLRFQCHPLEVISLATYFWLKNV